MALKTPTKGKPLGTYKRSIRESPRVKGLRSKLSPKEVCKGRMLVIKHAPALAKVVGLREVLESGTWGAQIRYSHHPVSRK